MAMRKTTIGTVTAIALVGTILSVFGALTSTRMISNTGTVRGIGVGVYFDAGCTNAVSSIAWGSLDPGATKNVTIYVRDEGNTAEALNMTTSSWSPSSASGSMTLSWNCESYVLSPGSPVQAVLSLSVAPSISGITTFSFNIIITGTAQ